MLLERTPAAVSSSRRRDGSGSSSHTSSSISSSSPSSSSSSSSSLSLSSSAITPEQPLTCMMYFFASQMSRNVGEGPARSTTSPSLDQPVHRLNALLAKVKTHAAFSPHVTQFDTFPVEIPEPPGGPGRQRLRQQQQQQSAHPRERVHDTMVLMKFRSKRAREQWIATREWIEFMDATEKDRVFRRMPHVRCAASLRGLNDPMDVLGF